MEIKTEVTFNSFRDLRILPLCFMVIYLDQHKEKLKSSVPVKMQITINIYSFNFNNFIQISDQYISQHNQKMWSLFTVHIYSFTWTYFSVFIHSFIHSFISIQPWRPGLAGTRAQSCDWYGSGTLLPGQVLGGSLPLLSPAFRRSHFSRQVPLSATLQYKVKWTSSIGNTNLCSLCDTEEQGVLSQLIWRSESIWKNMPNPRKPSHCPFVGNVHVTKILYQSLMLNWDKKCLLHNDHTSYRLKSWAAEKKATGNSVLLKKGHSTQWHEYVLSKPYSFYINYSLNIFNISNKKSEDLVL